MRRPPMPGGRAAVAMATAALIVITPSTSAVPALADARAERTGAIGETVSTGVAVPAGVATPDDATAPVAEDDAVDETTSLSTALAKLTGPLRTRLETRTSGDFWIQMSDTADLTAARDIADWGERGEYVYDALTRTAKRSQADLVAELRSSGTEFESHWIRNAIHVTDGSLALATDLAADPAVARLHEPVAVAQVEPIEQRADVGAGAGAGVEWGVDEINAPDVWALGYTGEGITVAALDSGVDGSHPALAAHYRGARDGGRADHDYNWQDVGGTCGGSPCDEAGHGTHVMGTLVGDDGAGNRTGVAPGAEWIATNGCDACTDADLLAAAEWILAPTRADGSMPSPAMRPHIVNNSWGSQIAGDVNSFFSDQVAAWDAAGIFTAWAAGNTGEAGCRSTSSPGANVGTYSVGATRPDGEIADFSARGPGEDGAIQPSIVAPGEDVRSTVPGGGYGLASGTSMAAPHVSGAVALLWSAVPSLIGDVEATRDLLNTTAVDHPSDECGGSSRNNNVFGEGELDVLALVRAAGVEQAGNIAGRVIAADGTPVGGAVVTAGDRSTGTGGNGEYSILLPVGSYDVAAEAFGYLRGAAGSLAVSDGETTAHDLVLDLAPTVTLRGTVTDGSGHGWPLGAKVAVAGAPPDTAVWSDPFTGEYALDIPAGGKQTLVVAPGIDGYRTERRDIRIGRKNLTRDIAVPVAPACVAPGYEFGGAGVPVQEFDSGALPQGWAVEDLAGTGQGWTFDDAFEQGNETTGEGLFAEVNSDAYGPDGHQDATLTTGALDFTGDTDPVLRFSQSFEALGGEFADVDLSVDDGETWETVLHQTIPAYGPTVVPLPAAADQDDVRVRFHYGDAYWAFWWQIDDVGFGECRPTDGGLVAGHVTDRNSGTGVVDASVSDADADAEAAVTTVDPPNPQVNAGYYAMFLPSGKHTLAVEQDGYVTDRSPVDVGADTVTRHDVELNAPKLTIASPKVSDAVALGDTGAGTFTVTNEGTAPTDVEMYPGSSDFEILAGGSPAGAIRGTAGAATEVRVAPGESVAGGGESGTGPSSSDKTFERHGDEPGAGAMPVPPASLRNAEGTTITHSASQEIVPDNSAACIGEGMQVLRTFTLEDFDIGGQFAVTSVSFGVELADAGTEVTVNLYTLDGDLVYDNLTRIGSATKELDAQELTLVDVPVEGTAPAGSTLVAEIATSGGPAFFTGSNAAGETAPTYIASEACGNSDPVKAADAGFPTMHAVLNVTGTTEVDVPWLDVQPLAFSLEPGESETVRVALDSGRIDQPGTYRADVVVAGTTPYRAPHTTVSMSVTPPRTWGRVAGTVTGTTCDGDRAPIEGAFVTIDGTEYDVTLVTGPDGGYARWMGVSNNPLELLSSADGYPPESATARLIAGQAVVKDFALAALCD